MFTGLVQSVGRVGGVNDDGHGGRVIHIVEPAMAPTLVIGESVAVDGVCLTVVDRDERSFRFQAGPETLMRSTIGLLDVDAAVNLERALRAGDPIGGHFVTGHVDAVGRVAEHVKTGEWETVRIECPADLDDLLVAKGSVAVDGISLTLVDVSLGHFSVMLIPHTQIATTLGVKPVGASVNIECDLIAKQVRKLFQNITVTI